MLGYHINTWTGAARGSVRTANPHAIKILQTAVDRDEILRWRAVVPGGLLLYRHAFDIRDSRDPAWRCSQLLSGMAKIADLVDVVETPWNEEMQGSGELVQYADMTNTAVSILESEGYATCIGNFSTGQPALGDLHLFDLALFPSNRPKYLGLHEYGAPTMIGAPDCLRYKAWHSPLPVMITECGIDGGVIGNPGKGWRIYANASQYSSQLAWYRDSIAGSTVAAFVFACGTYDDFSTFDVAGESAIENVARTHMIIPPFTPGIDVSNHQKTIDWVLVSRCGPRFAVIKATEGQGYTDAFFKANWQGAADNGLVRGAYCFGRPSQGSGHDDAVYFLSVVQPVLQKGDFLVLDLEDVGVPANADLHAYALDWLQTVYAAVGFRPMLYTGDWYAKPHNLELEADLALYGLYQAAYQTTYPTTLPGWPFWAIWQYSASGTIPGITGSVDLDLFNGSVDLLKLYGKP